MGRAVVNFPVHEARNFQMNFHHSFPRRRENTQNFYFSMYYVWALLCTHIFKTLEAAHKKSLSECKIKDGKKCASRERDRRKTDHVSKGLYFRIHEEVE